MHIIAVKGLCIIFKHSSAGGQQDTYYCVLTEDAGHEIAGHENTGHEFARHDKCRMKIDYITLECAFLLNFNLLYVRRVC